MIGVPNWPLACPLDGQPLQCQGQSWLCPRGHCFDVAKQGYINLLAAQHKRSKNPGDRKAMVAARTAFLNHGLYQPIADAVSAQVIENSNAEGPLSIADMGCGEGYYLNQLVQQLAQAEPHRATTALGLDISKWAITAAAKQYSAPLWLVASNRNPPLLPDSVDWLLSLFGFNHFAGFQKPLKPGGQLLVVDAGPKHLIELRELLYETVKISSLPSLDEAEQFGFAMADEQVLRFPLQLASQEQIYSLLAMTPHYYRADKNRLEQVLAMGNLMTTAEVVLRRLVYQP